MRVIHARNVSDALILGMQAVHQEGKQRDSRNGPVKVFDTPVTTCYECPWERVLLHPERDANPFFHFMEALWMIGGRRDVAFVSQFAGNIANYSDDGVTFHGAYGFRWRHHFDTIDDERMYDLDQFLTIVNLLNRNPDDRRVVLQMWDPTVDLGMEGKDFPCNLTATFRVNNGKLDMTVFNRSNDMIWGAYGANAVHFSMLQEVIAAFVGVEIGRYWQVSTNFHAYDNVFEKHAAGLLDKSAGFSEYETGQIQNYPMVNSQWEDWLAELKMFLEEPLAMGFNDPFFRKVAQPMFAAWLAWKDRENPNHYRNAMDHLDGIIASDWRTACQEWITRRHVKRNV